MSAALKDTLRDVTKHSSLFGRIATSALAEIERLEQQLAEAQAELRLRNDELRAIRHTIVATIGGTDYEGNPTSEINWLQRLRILVERERELAVRKDGMSARIMYACDSHGDWDSAKESGCPQCVRELRAQLAEAQAAIRALQYEIESTKKTLAVATNSARASAEREQRLVAALKEAHDQLGFVISRNGYSITDIWLNEAKEFCKSIRAIVQPTEEKR